MTMTDPIADMLTRVRNANVAMHDTVPMPSSKLKESLAALLEREDQHVAEHQRSVEADAATIWPPILPDFQPHNIRLVLEAPSLHGLKPPWEQGIRAPQVQVRFIWEHKWTISPWYPLPHSGNYGDER